MRPKYDLDKIKFATDAPTFEKANPTPKRAQIIPDSEENRYLWDNTRGIIEAPERELFEPYTRISTGAGGRDNLLRYYVVLHQKEKRVLGDKERNIIGKKFEDVARETSAVIEYIQFEKTYVMFQILLSFHIAVGSFIEKGIASCRKDLPLLCESYFVTNIKKPSRKDLTKFLSED